MHSFSTNYVTIADFWCTIFITHKLELLYDYTISKLATVLVQIFVYYRFCLKEHSLTINALHQIDNTSCMFYYSVMCV